MKIEYLSSLNAVTATAWNALIDQRNPFVRYEFLAALEQQGCLLPFGWKPLYIVATEQDQLLGALPLYLKTNSYGEFVFDWAWASAYERMLNQPYYPKLVCSIPYTPATGPRLLIAATANYELVATGLCQAVQELAQQLHVSSMHYLFTDERDSAYLEQQPHLMQRISCQFHWENHDFRDFEDYLSQFSSKKRKQIKKERREAAFAGLEIELLNGHQANEQHWQIFHQFYCDTFDRKTGTPTLTLDFFKTVAQTMPESILLVMAKTPLGEYVAGALNFRGEDTLYGRHWGCHQHFPHLHFELCYYQTLDYCIEQRLKRFEAGAQGEHKLSRGFLPTVTKSFHWIANPRFAQLVKQFLTQETPAVHQYMQELAEHSPFKHTQE